MIWQLAYNTLITVAAYSLIGLAFFFALGTCRHFHFVVASAFLAAPYLLAWSAPGDAGAFRLAATSLGIIALLAAAGAALEWTVFRPLRARRAPPIHLTILSLVLLFVSQNAISILVSGQTVRTSGATLDSGAIALGQIMMSCQQLVAIGVNLTTAVGAFLLWKKSLVGLVFRAIQEDDRTSATIGIPVPQWRTLAVAAAFALAALAGIAYSLDTFISPQMGFEAAFVGMAAVIIGGRTYIWQPLVGVAIIGITKNAAAYWFPGNWEPSVTFAACLVSLLISPEWKHPLATELNT